MIEVVVEEMHGSDRVSEPEIDYERAWVDCAQFIYESEMALFLECMQSCAQKVVDTADIVRDAMFRQLPGNQGRKRKRPRLVGHGTLAEQPSPEVCSPPLYVLA